MSTLLIDVVFSLLYWSGLRVSTIYSLGDFEFRVTFVD